jgi:hypothetical protein
MSSQATAVVPMQAPPAHRSPVVQAFPSLQVRVLSVNTQPAAGLHASVVQTFPSVHPSVPVAPHDPAEQMSPVVHASPSSHAAVLFAWTNPVAPHESVVHGFSSLHPAGTQAPAQHVSSLAHRRVRTQVPLGPPMHVAVSHGPAVHVVAVHVGY